MPISNFKRWMKQSSPDEKKALAKGAKTSVNMLYQLGYGTRKASSELAARVENAAAGEIARGDLNATCEKCPYFKRCRNERS